MIKHIKPLPASEEMLGAYFEGNLAPHDARYIEQMIQDNNEYSTFIDELAVSDELVSNYIREIANLDIDFALPEIPTGIETSIDSHILPLEFEPSFADVADCAAMPDIEDDGNIVTNTDMPEADISDLPNMGIDINNEDLSFDGEQ